MFGNINFDGVFLNGKKWRENKCSLLKSKVDKLDNGKLYIKEFNNRGNINFEAEFFCGEKNGKGKEYNFGRLIFEGEYLNGKKNGKGKEYIKEKISFEGEYLYNMKLKGKKYVNEKLEFEAEFLYGEKNGKGKEYHFGKLIFEGEYLNGKKMEKEKNILKIKFHSKENIYIIWNLKEKNMLMEN